VSAAVAVRARTLGDELGADDRDVARGLDPEPHLTPFEPHDGDTNVVADEQLLHQLSGEHQHSA